MLKWLMKVIIFVCGLVVFEVALLSFVFLSAKVDSPVQHVASGESEVTKVPAYDLVSGIVPHHDLAKGISGGFWQTIKSQAEPETIVILSPDHFDFGNLDNQQKLITVDQTEIEFAGVAINNDLLSALTAADFNFNTPAVSFDHGVMNLLPDIKKYLPRTAVLPVLIPKNTKRSVIFKFIQGLRSDSNLMVVASTDFSHYLPLSAADLHDTMSQRVILDFEVAKFEKLDVDCWQCVYGARLYSRLKGFDDYEIIGSGNSAEIVNDNQADSTTSYFSIIFGRGKFAASIPPRAKSMIFVGDIMLDRGVKSLMNKNSTAYPFAGMKLLFQGVDYVSANLEGPIVKNPRPAPYNSLVFNFDPAVLPEMQAVNINLVTLANNHILNRGKSGFQETKDFLTAASIDYSGDAFKCSPDLAQIKDDIVFLGINKTFPTSCFDQEIAKTIKILKQTNPEHFLIVSIHWGNEYKTINSSAQQKLAHLMIDNGADLIIGHHPHVIENIEKYKNKLIFYSLGNFIFDQYFSVKTQQGLAIGLELWPDKQVYRIFPLDLSKSQPKLMTHKQAAVLLAGLAVDSSKDLQMAIKDGLIETKK